MKKSWFRNHRRLLIIAGGVLLVVATLTVGYFLTSGQKTETAQIAAPVKKAEPVRHYSPLSGRETSEKKTSAPVLAVMIENSPEARPQSGLTEAGVVFEAVAEGGITRFVALYQETEPALVGPVRSVRPYYLEWAAAFDPAVAHVGGSDDALKMIRGGGYGVDLDQFFNDSAYWRSKDRRAPHNMYTDHARLLKLAEEKGKNSAKFTGFNREEVPKTPDRPKHEEPADTENSETTAPPTANSINFAMSSNPYAVHYDYNKETNTYLRAVGGKPHMNRAADKTDSQIAPDVVIAMRVRQTLTNDRLHNQITTAGSGEVYVFQNGLVIKGTWTKSSPSAQIHFTDHNNQEIKLKRGQVWLTAVPNDKGVSWQ